MDTTLEGGAVHPGTHAVAVDQEGAGGGEDEQHLVDVQHADAGRHKGDAVQAEQQSGHQPELGGAGQSPSDPHDHEHHQHAGDRGREPPAHRRVAEQKTADGLDLLGDRRMDHQPVGGVLLDAQLRDVERLRRVVLLVEDRSALVRGGGQAPEAGDERQQQDHARDEQIPGCVDRPGVGGGERAARRAHAEGRGHRPSIVGALRSPGLRWAA